MKYSLITLSALALIVFLIAPLGARAGLYGHMPGMAAFALSGLIAAICLALALIALARNKERPKKIICALAALFSLAPTLIAGNLLFQSSNLPRIHNISTDPNAAHCIAAQQRRPEGSNPLIAKPETIALQRQAYPDIHPIYSALQPQQAYERALSLARLMNWDIYLEDASRMRIEGVETTAWFGFKDDICLQITASGPGSQINLRSVSRIGLGDLGANAARIKKFQELFQTL